MVKKITLAGCVFSLIFNFCSAQKGSDQIRLNQIGFYPSGPKTAVIVDSEADKFFIVSLDSKDTVFNGKLENSGKWEHSDEMCKKADFSKLKKEGRYVVSVPGLGISHPFNIKSNVHLDLAKGAMKAYYYNRASIEITPEYGGKWARKAGHPDTKVLVHGSAATATRPEGTAISSPRGWYDAGDYNKYIVNSGISTYTLLAAYENFPKLVDTLKLNIPERNNKIPDVLDEVLWNLRWMLTMQDEDGGVYHKLTNPNFDGVVMPDAANAPRYVVQKGTAASLDFAAVMAQASRVFGKFKKELPGLSDSCLKASVAAYNWAKKNPNIEYRQSQINQNFMPAIRTGAYDDAKFEDEFAWAAVELFITTGKTVYWEESKFDFLLKGKNLGIPGWQTVNTLGLYTLAQHKDKLRLIEGFDVEAINNKLLELATPYKSYAFNSAYGVPMGQASGDFAWGSNSIAGNQAILLIHAYRVGNDKDYLNAAIAQLDYLLGRNATSYSFVTGFGSKPAMNPHHRPSEADGIPEPVPGFLVGGPNPGQEDKGDCPGAVYPSSLTAKSYADHWCSYASNEIAINWNAPLAYLSIAIEALKGK
ncbi:MAG: glycoside hydrolase family 9 protein [Cytophagaceae bacterium]